MKYLWIIPSVILLTCAVGKRENPFDPNGVNWNPPVVTAMNDVSVNINDSITITAIAIDNGTVMKFFWALNGISYSDTSTAGNFRTAFKSIGVKKVLVKVVDNDGVVSQPDTCLITVKLDPPVVTAMTDASVNINDSITVTATATDNGTVMKFFWALNGTDFSDTTPTGTIRTAFGSAGAKNVLVQVIDDDGIVSQPDTCVITVTLDAPVVIALKDTSVSINDSITITATATDNGTVMKFFWALNGTDFSDTTPTGTIRTAFGNAGTKMVLVKVIDDDGIVSQPDTCVITVMLNPPVVTAMKDTSININDNITITATATDNGTVMKFFWALNGTDYSDTTTTGTIRTAFGSAGAKNVLVQVIDDDGIVSQPDTCVITVTLDAPVLTARKDTVVSQSMNVTVNVVAVDTNSSGSIVKYYWDIGADGWDDSTVAANYTFSKPEGGLMTVIWGARDDDGVISTDTFTIIFSRPPSAVTMIEPTNGGMAKWLSYDPLIGKGRIVMQFSGTDPDGVFDTLTYTLALGKSAGSLSQVYNGKIISYTATGIDTLITYYWRITARDLFGDSVFSIGKFVAPPPKSITDIDGNIYNLVKIGNQVWMVENLKTTRYNDGTKIQLVTDNTAWFGLTTSGYCWYNNDTANKNTYGALYNWYTVDPKNINKLAPTGWHVPSDTEWNTLVAYLGDTSVAGGKLKEAGLTHWNSPNTGATNETGFSALPGGSRNYLGPFQNIGSYGYWWSSTEYGIADARFRTMYYNNAYITRDGQYKNQGFSVRCIRD